MDDLTPGIAHSRNVNELFLRWYFILDEAVINLNNREILDNIHDDKDNHVPGPDLGDMGFTTKRTLEVKDV